MKTTIPKELILKAMEILADRNVGQGVAFDLAGTDQCGFLRLEKGYGPGRAVCLKTAAVENGDDHLVQHFYHYAGSPDEMKRWLLDARNADGILESLQQLSDRVAQGFD